MATLAQNITKAINDFDNIKTAIQSKGVVVASGTPTSDYDNLISNIPRDDSIFKGLVQRTATSIIIPQGTTSIGSCVFYSFTLLESIIIPNSVTSIGNRAFESCQALTNVTIPDSVTSMDSEAFRDCNNISSLTIGSGLTTIPNYAFYNNMNGTGTLTIPDNITHIGTYAFSNWRKISTINIGSGVIHIGDEAFSQAYNLTTLSIPSSITTIAGKNTFRDCSKLENVTIANGFNANGLNLSWSTLYSVATIVSWLNALADRTGQTTYTLTIGTTNKNKLTAEQIAIATNKNWILV